MDMCLLSNELEEVFRGPVQELILRSLLDHFPVILNSNPVSWALHLGLRICGYPIIILYGDG